MGIGETKVVNLENYFAKVVSTGESQKCKDEILNALAPYEMGENVTVYKETSGNGTILFKYQIGQGKDTIPGVLKFSVRLNNSRYCNNDSGISEGLSGGKVVYEASDACRPFMITALAGLFGSSEAYIGCPQFDDPYKDQRRYGDVLFELGCSKKCSEEQVQSEIKILHETDEKERQETAKKVAEEQIKAAQKAEDDRIEAEKNKIADLIKDRRFIFQKARDLIELARDCDKGPLGIDPDDLREIYNNYAIYENIITTTLDEAQQYYDKAYKMFEKMVKDDSGAHSIEEAGNRIDCSYSEKWLVATCKEGNHSEGGRTESVACKGIGYGLEIFTISYNEPYCRSNPRNWGIDRHPDGFQKSKNK